MIEIITFVETSRADWALIKIKPYYSLKPDFYTRIFSNTHMLPWLLNNKVILNLLNRADTMNESKCSTKECSVVYSWAPHGTLILEILLCK